MTPIQDVTRGKTIRFRSHMTSRTKKRTAINVMMEHPVSRQARSWDRDDHARFIVVRGNSLLTKLSSYIQQCVQKQRVDKTTDSCCGKFG